LKSRILLVEDNPDILKYVQMTLEFNEYKVLTAMNGKDALNLLSECEDPPDLIISDIMMPEMNGYDFFYEVSEHPKYCSIPFIFLTALGSDEDIRLGKMLGVDDYLTKPIDEEDLLAVISGKLKRNKRISMINKKMEDAEISIEEDYLPKEQKDLIVLIKVVWDDRLGPVLENYFPKNSKLEDSVKKIGSQLYDAISSIYGQNSITRAEGLLINLRNFNIMAYTFFDSYIDDTFRGGRRDYMFSILAPKITYFHSLKIKKKFHELSLFFKENKELDLKLYWDQFTDILTGDSE